MSRHPKTEDSALIAVAEIIGMVAGSYVATGLDRVRRALPSLSNVVALLPSLPMLVWHTVLYGLAEPGERAGERR